MSKEIEELKIEEQPREKVFYVGIRDYTEGGMYAVLEEKLSDYILKHDRVYKIAIPTI